MYVPLPGPFWYHTRRHARHYHYTCGGRFSHLSYWLLGGFAVEACLWLVLAEVVILVLLGLAAAQAVVWLYERYATRWPVPEWARRARIFP